MTWWSKCCFVWISSLKRNGLKQTTNQKISILTSVFNRSLVNKVFFPLVWLITKLRYTIKCFSNVISKWYIFVKTICCNCYLCLFWHRAGEESEHLVMDAHPPDGAAHQWQQPDPNPAGHRQAAQPGLPEPVIKQAPQPTRRTGQHGLSQVCCPKIIFVGPGQESPEILLGTSVHTV